MLNRAAQPDLPTRIGLLFLGLMWGLPFLQYHHAFPLPGFYSEWIAFASGLLAGLLLWRQRYWSPVEFPRIGLLPVMLVALLLLQLALGMSSYPQRTLLASLYLLWAALLIWLGNGLVKTVGDQRLADVLAGFALAGGTVNALLGILQSYGIHTLLDPFITASKGSAFGNLAQPNHFADYLGISLASLYYLAARFKAWRWPTLALMPLLTFGMGISGSRSSWLYLAALMALAGILYFKERKNPAGKAAQARFLFGLSCLALPVFAGAQYAAHLFPVHGGFLVTSTDRLEEVAQGFGIRLSVWQEAWHVFLLHPVLGVGFGQFGWYRIQDLGQGELLPGWWSNAHNVFMQLLAEFGVVGASAFAGFVAYWMRGLKSAPFTLSRWWMLGVLAIIGIHSNLEYPLWYAYFLGIAALLVGATAEGMLSLHLSRFTRWIFLVVLMLGGISAANAYNNYSSLERQFQSVYHNKMSKAEARTFLHELGRISRESLLTPYIDLTYTGIIALDRSDIEDKLAFNSRVMYFAPTRDVMYRQAGLLAVAGKEQEARVQLDLAIKAYPEQLASAVADYRKANSRDAGSLAGLAAYGETKLKEQKRVVH